MHQELAHRPRGVYTHTVAFEDADTSAAAIEALRAKIPAEDLILYVKTAD
jgi:hypothetical protein